ncbi:serine hydrolase [Emticicia sp. SJ17W-69]|uniref:serine hydrolase n=1 Tax=Emticicia sp. SJ17W-69 TaxID=3421657 RepID=UPI003EC0499F
MKKEKKIFLFVGFILLIINNLIAQENKAKQIDTLMKRSHQLGIFNGNVLVIEKGKTIYQSSFGYANASKTTKLNADYIFNIGSISKEFNAVGIMMLKEQGKLILDDKVSKYLPELPNWATKISIKNLLQYTSGLPDINWKTIKSDADILSDMKQVTKLDFEPGTNYAYNNSNVFLQRRIIEKITNVPFHTFVEIQMLQPCGMKSSVVDPDMRGKNIAISFNNDLIESPRQFQYVMSGWTAVTTQDLYRWTQCLHHFKIINKASFNEILVPVFANKQSGLGAGSIDGDGIKEHYHHGSSTDFEALMFTEPTTDISIILLTNNMNFKLFEIKDAIKSILNGVTYKTPKKSLLMAMRKNIDTQNIEELLTQYNHLKTSQANDFNFEDENDLNQIGYYLMNKKRFDDAIQIFELNVKLFPQSGNAYDSLGEAYLNKGNKPLALLNYKKALALDPKNAGAKEIIEKMAKE